MNLFNKQSWLVVFLVGGLAACSSATKIESDLGIKDAPDWVNEGSSAVSDQKGRLIQGVGMASPLGDTSLQRNTADNRARAEVARILNVYIDSTTSDFTSSENGAVDISVSREINGVTKLALSGSKILGRWKDPATGDIYSFAEMDISKVDEMLKASEGLNDAFKTYYNNYAADKFEALVESE